MGDSFKGSDHVDLQPGDVNVPLGFRFNPCSASTANDGAIPYGSTLASSTWSVHLHDNTGVTASTMVVAVSVSSERMVTAYATWSSGFIEGLYDVVVQPTFSLSGSTRVMTRQYDFDRVYLRNR